MIGTDVDKGFVGVGRFFVKHATYHAVDVAFTCDVVSKQWEMLHIFSTDFDTCLKDVDLMAFRTTGWNGFGGGEWCEVVRVASWVGWYGGGGGGLMVRWMFGFGIDG